MGSKQKPATSPRVVTLAAVMARPSPYASNCAFGRSAALFVRVLSGPASRAMSSRILKAVIACAVVSLAYYPAASRSAPTPPRLEEWLRNAQAELRPWQDDVLLQVPSDLNQSQSRQQILEALRVGPPHIRTALIRSIGEAGVASPVLVRSLIAQLESADSMTVSQAMFALSKLDNTAEDLILKELFAALAIQRRIDEGRAPVPGDRATAHAAVARRLVPLAATLALRPSLDLVRFLKEAGLVLQSLNPVGILGQLELARMPRPQGRPLRWGRDNYFAAGYDRPQTDMRGHNLHGIYRSFVEIVRIILKDVDSGDLMAVLSANSGLNSHGRAVAIIVLSGRKDRFPMTVGPVFEDLIASRDRVLATCALDFATEALGILNPELERLLKFARLAETKQIAAYTRSNIKLIRSNPPAVIYVLEEWLNRSVAEGARPEQWAQEQLSRALVAVFNSGVGIPKKENIVGREDHPLPKLLKHLDDVQRASVLQAAFARILSGVDADSRLALDGLSGDGVLRSSEVAQLIGNLRNSPAWMKRLSALSIVAALPSDRQSNEERIELLRTLLQPYLERGKEPGEEREDYRDTHLSATALVKVMEPFERLSTGEPGFTRVEDLLTHIDIDRSRRDYPIFSELQKLLISRGDPESIALLEHIARRSREAGPFRMHLCRSSHQAKSLETARRLILVAAEGGGECDSAYRQFLIAERDSERVSGLLAYLGKDKHSLPAFSEQLLRTSDPNSVKLLIDAYLQGAYGPLFHLNSSTFLVPEIADFPDLALNALKKCLPDYRDSYYEACKGFLNKAIRAGMREALEALHEEYLVEAIRSDLTVERYQSKTARSAQSSAGKIANALGSSTTLSRRYENEVIARSYIAEQALGYLSQSSVVSMPSLVRIYTALGNDKAGRELLASSGLLSRASEAGLSDLLREFLDANMDREAKQLRSIVAATLFDARQPSGSGSAAPPDLSGLFAALPPLLPWPAAYSHVARLEDLAGASAVRAGDTVGAVVNRLRKALTGIDTRFESGIFGVPGGFILLTRLERSDADGRPLDGRLRWLKDSDQVPSASAAAYVEALFRVKPGFARLFGFLFSVEGALPPSATEVAQMPPPRSGLLELPDKLAMVDAKLFHKHVLVFAFERRPGGSPALDTRLSAAIHVKQSGFLRRLD